MKKIIENDYIKNINKNKNNELKKYKRFYIKKIYILLKLLLLLFILFFFRTYNLNIHNNNQKIYYSYIKYKVYERIKGKKIFKNIKFGIYIFSLSNGGRERLTSLLINYLYREKIFEIYLFTKKNRNPYEYEIPDNVTRIKISGIEDIKNNLIKNNINILVYQDYNIKEMEILNRLKNVKVIFYNHSTFIFWIYFRNNLFLKYLYNQYKKSKYIISLIPFENDFLFKKWNISSILAIYKQKINN